MTKPMMDLRELVEKSAGADLLREMIGFAAERLMELEEGAKTGKLYLFASIDRTSKFAFSRPIHFDMICETNGIEHRLTKPNQPWTNGQVERMNRTIKEAMVKSFHRQSRY